jgi:hypothetical protein
LPRELVFVTPKAHGVEQFAGAFCVLFSFLLEVGTVGFHDLEWQQHVVEGGAPRQQGRGLKRHAADFERTGDRLAINQDAAFAGHLQTRGQLHEGGLAAARWPNDGDELALLDLQVDVFDSEVVLRQQLVVVGQPDILEINE